MLRLPGRVLPLRVTRRRNVPPFVPLVRSRRRRRRRLRVNMTRVRFPG